MGKFYEKNQLVSRGEEEKNPERRDLSFSGLNVLRGFKFTLVYIQNELNLQVDACSRVLQRKSLL